MRKRHTPLVLITNRDDKENIIKQMALARYERHPEDFEGEELYINFKLRHVSLCREFEGLKEYILRVKESTGLRCEFKGFIAIDITEWNKYETNEYFEAFLKYLCDHQDFKQYIFIIHGENIKKLQKLIYQIMEYMNIRIKEIIQNKTKDELFNLIDLSMKRRKMYIEKDVLEWFSDIMFSEKKIDFFNKYIRNSVINEIMTFTKDKQITQEALIKYMNNESTLLGMLGNTKKWGVHIEDKQL